MKLADSYEFDDVLVKPVPSSVSSRDDVDISVKLSDDLTLKFPLIASPMVGVVDGNFAKQLADLGGLAIIHRFYPSREEKLQDIVNNHLLSVPYGISIRIGEDNIEQYLAHSPSILLVDTANGYTKKLLEYCEKVKNIIEKSRLTWRHWMDVLTSIMSDVT
jgi:IMP dehydrogenase/GMP reductase